MLSLYTECQFLQTYLFEWSDTFLAATTRHSGDGYSLCRSASCSLKLDDEALRVAVDLRIRIDVCVPHPSRCGLLGNAPNLHSLIWYSRHHALSDRVAGSFAGAGLPVINEQLHCDQKSDRGRWLT